MSCGTLEDSNRSPLRLMISKLIGSDIKAKGLPIRIATNARIVGPRVLIRAIEPTVTSKVAWRKRLAWDEPRAYLAWLSGRIRVVAFGVFDNAQAFSTGRATANLAIVQRLTNIQCASLQHRALSAQL